LSATHAHRTASLADHHDGTHYNYADLSQDYLNIGVSGLNRIISDLFLSTHEDIALYRIVFVSSLLVCYITLGQGPQASHGEYLFFSDYGPGQWEPLLKGVKAVMDISQKDFIALVGGLVTDYAIEGHLEQQLQCPSESAPKYDFPPAARSWKQNMDAMAQLMQPSTHITQNTTIMTTFDTDQKAENDALRTAYDHLYKCYAIIFPAPPTINEDISTISRDDVSDSDRGLYSNVLGWPFCLPAEMTVLLSTGAKQSSQPSYPDKQTTQPPNRNTVIAFLLVAYFCPLLQTLCHEWFITGWPEHVLGACEHILGALLNTEYSSPHQHHHRRPTSNILAEQHGSIDIDAHSVSDLLTWPRAVVRFPD